MRTETRVNGITEGRISQQLLLFFFPILFGTFFQQLYNTVDAIVVGQYLGTEALAAVGGGTGTAINGSCFLFRFFPNFARPVITCRDENENIGPFHCPGPSLMLLTFIVHDSADEERILLSLTLC